MCCIPDQIRPYYYALVAPEGSVPVCEFLTSRHRNRWLSGMLDIFMEDIMTVAGRRLHPQVVVVDFSYALLYTVLWIFNASMLTRYLKDTWELLQGDANARRTSRSTVVRLCIAHFVKAAASRLVKVDKDKSIRQATLAMHATEVKQSNESCSRKKRKLTATFTPQAYQSVASHMSNRNAFQQQC